MFAAVGVDYSLSSTFFSLEPDQESVKLDIDIINDNIVETLEFFDLVIVDASLEVLLDDRYYTQVQIRDTDRTLLYTTVPVHCFTKPIILRLCCAYTYLLM